MMSMGQFNAVEEKSRCYAPYSNNLWKNKPGYTVNIVAMEMTVLTTGSDQMSSQPRRELSSVVFKNVHS